MNMNTRLCRFLALRGCSGALRRSLQRTIITALLAIVALAGQAKTYKTIKNPVVFHFGGIPHYETITPDSRRVRDDLRINGYYTFNYELERLLEKLK